MGHRSWHSKEHPGIESLNDRLEIWSDGTLPFGLKPEDLKQ